MVTFSIRYCYAYKYIQSWIYKKLGPVERKQNELAVNTKVGQLFLLGLFLRHYFVDSNIRNLWIGHCRVSCIKTIFFPLHFFHISRFHSVTSNSKSFSPAATMDPRPATIIQTRNFPSNHACRAAWRGESTKRKTGKQVTQSSYAL